MPEVWVQMEELMADEPRNPIFYNRRTRTFGPDYEVPLDAPRIEKQHERIREYMRTVGWKTLAEIESATGDPQSSISAQLRHLRKPKFGGWVVDKRRREGHGTWEYRLSQPEPETDEHGQVSLL